MSFFRFIHREFGQQNCYNLKIFMRRTKLAIKLKLRIKFIRKCIKHKLQPKHTNFRLLGGVNVFQPNSKKLLNNIKSTYILKILKIELKDAYLTLHKVNREMYKIQEELHSRLPDNLLRNFFDSQYYRNRKIWYIENTKIKNKIQRLISQQRIATNRSIKPVKIKINSNNNNNVTIITPDKFKTPNNINKIQEGWFLNLSNVHIPKDVELLLQMGDRFNLPLVNNSNAIIENIKQIESNIRNCTEELRCDVRNETINICNAIEHHTHKDKIDKTIINRYKKTQKFIKEHPEILFTRADKGNTTVAIHQKDYITKIEQLLQDKDTYTIVKKDPTRKITDQLRNMLKQWRNNNYITDRTYKMLMTNDGNLARAYGVPKIHKKGYPYRIIISTINSPINKLAQYLHDKLNNSINTDNNYSIKNSYELIKKLQHIVIPKNHKLASLDVISLFTNIPTDKAIESITNKWEKISQHTHLPLESFIQAIQFIFDSTYFTFNKTIYKQIFGTPMGSPLSPIIADIVMQELESRAIEEIPYNIPIYYRYVDDIILAAPTNSFDEILAKFNSKHDRLKFTIELSQNNKINFLNVTLSVEEKGRMSYNIHYKPTFSGRFINYYSHHPWAHKKGVIFGLVDRAIKLADNKWHTKNIEQVISILIKNSYPLKTIFQHINKRLTILYTKKEHNTENNEISKEEFNYFCIPYTKNISEIYREKFKTEFKTAYRCHNKLNRIIKGGKDRIEPLQQTGVVYKLNCQNCEASYVGQTKRKLTTRIKEHKADIKKEQENMSVVSTHRISNNHDFQWENVEILDIEQNYHRRLISEMIHIKGQKEGINKQSDVQLLPECYHTIIRKHSQRLPNSRQTAVDKTSDRSNSLTHLYPMQIDKN